MPCRICSFAKHFSEGVIRCKIVAADFAAEEIPEVSRNSHGHRKMNDRSSRVGILVRKKSLKCFSSQQIEIPFLTIF